MNNVRHTISEFKPALRFLLVFIFCYVVMSLLYGLFIESYGDKIDPWTKHISQQVALVLSSQNNPVEVIDGYGTRSCVLADREGQVISIFEGCNGLNVIILFLSFLIAYQGPIKRFVLFSLVGVILIHLVNIGRVAMLYFVAKNYPGYMYFAHKYLFTAIIYAVVFLLWYLWVNKYNAIPKFTNQSTNT